MRYWMCVVAVASAVATASGEFPQVRLDPISQGEIVSPVAITNAGDGSNRLFVVDQRGTINVLENETLVPTPFLDIQSNLVSERPGFDERGLLGLAFHPNFGDPAAANSDKFYVYYSAPHPTAAPNDPTNPIDHQSVIAEFSVTAPGANTADPTSERILMTFDQPQFNHDGGYLGFGPDGMLYITTGDGGGGGDNEPGHTGGGDGDPSGGLGNSQDRSNLLGNILRIDVDGRNSSNGQYGVPSDNPFVGEAGVREEIFAYGLRNPWRASFDDGPGGTGRMFIADVGQGDVEEINLLEPGANYGWRILEGSFDFDDSVAPTPNVSLVGPIAEYAHPGTEVATSLPEIGLSVTGGVVHRGAAASLNGKYLFGDWSNGFSEPNGTLLGLEEMADGSFDLSVLDVIGGNPIGEFVLAFGLDESGEAYVATKSTLAASALDSDGNPTGNIYRIAAVPEPNGDGLLLVASLLAVAFRRIRIAR